MSARRTTARDRITVAKDLILFTAGLVLIFRQGWFVPRADFNWVVFAFGVALTQAPGAMAMISLARTGGDSSSSALPAGSPPSLPSSPSTPGDG
jgi:hypothetical protein